MMKKLSLLGLVFLSISLQVEAGTFSISRSFSAPRSFSVPRPTYRPSIPAPRPVVINKTTVVRQHSSVTNHSGSSGGGFLSSFAGSMAGSWIGAWLFNHNSQPSPQPPAPTIDCSLEGNKNVAACQSTAK